MSNRSNRSGSAPVVVVPAEALGIDHTPGGLPNLPADVLAVFLEAARADLEGPDRAFFVVVFDGAVPIRCQLKTLEPSDNSNDQFLQDCRRAWNNYSVGRTVPVIMCRVRPTPFTGLLIAPLPWADVGTFCSRCGSVDHEIQRCP